MKRSTLKGIIAICVAALLGSAYVITALAFNKQWNPLKWGKKVEVTQPDNNQGNEFTDGELVHVTEDKGIKLRSARIAPDDYADYGVEAQADSAYTITATVNEDAADKSVIGSIKWKNPDSEWATGKNISTYISLTQTEQYGLNFVLTAKHPFGEPVELKVASCMDSSVNATAQIDCLKKLKWFNAVLNPSLSETAAGRVYVGDTMNTIQVKPEYGVGTIEGNISGYRAEITTNSYFQNNLKSALDVGTGTSNYSPATLIYTEGKDFKIELSAGSRMNPPNSYGGLVYGVNGDVNALKVVLNNFIKNKGCGDACGILAATAGVTNIKYYITYSFGSDYSVELYWNDDSSHGFRNDNLATISMIKIMLSYYLLLNKAVEL